MVRLIGDIHGIFSEYKLVAIDSPDGQSIQVGDFGIGFSGDFWHDKVNDFHTEENYYRAHRFIRGNHDNPAKCKSMNGYIHDGTTQQYGNTKVTFIGGAWSIDWKWRTEGYDWWRDEELSVREFEGLILNYETYKPDVMITHDGPLQATEEMFIKTGKCFGGTNAKSIKTTTGLALQAMFEIHQPKFWFFGHWHHTVEQDINGTHFHCLGELDYADFNFENCKYMEKKND